MNAWLLTTSARHEAPAEPQGISQLRHEARNTLEGWGLGEMADAAELIASELLTNALLYGNVEILTLKLTLDELWLSLSVADANPTPPYPCGIDEQAEGGRGLYLTVALADAWGFRATSTGKSVFAEFLARPVGGDDRPATDPATPAPPNNAQRLIHAFD